MILHFFHNETKGRSRGSISPRLMEIEITEDSLIKNEGSALPTIHKLRDFGIAIAIDDFGTGYSSIGYLKKFKVDYIKIDRSFIKIFMKIMRILPSFNRLFYWLKVLA